MANFRVPTSNGHAVCSLFDMSLIDRIQSEWSSRRDRLRSAHENLRRTFELHMCFMCLRAGAVLRRSPLLSFSYYSQVNAER